MIHARLQLYLQLQQAKRTKTVMKLINTVRGDLYEDGRALLRQVIDLARVIGLDELMEETQKALAQMEMEKKP